MTRKDEMFKWKDLKYSFLLHGCSRSLSSSFWKYFVILLSSHLVITFIRSRSLVLFEIHLSATLGNFNLLSLTVISMRFLSSRLNNWRNSLVQTAQNHLDLSFSNIQNFACLIYYIGYVPKYHIRHIGLNQNHKRLFHYVFYMESVLPT